MEINLETATAKDLLDFMGRFELDDTGRVSNVESYSNAREGWKRNVYTYTHVEGFVYAASMNLKYCKLYRLKG